MINGNVLPDPDNLSPFNIDILKIIPDSPQPINQPGIFDEKGIRFAIIRFFIHEITLFYLRTTYIVCFSVSSYFLTFP